MQNQAFFAYTSFLKVLTEKKIVWTRLDGQTPVLERQVGSKEQNYILLFLFFLHLPKALIDQFDSDPSIETFLLSTKAGGVGITLTAASAVIFMDLSFNPQWDRQAEDRAHRIGQASVFVVGPLTKREKTTTQTKEVCVYRIVAKDTIEESIYDVQQEKLSLHNGVLQEGGDAEGDGEKLKAQEVKKLLAHYFESVEMKMN